MGMQIDSSTDRHTAHCSVTQLYIYAARFLDSSGKLGRCGAARPDRTGPDRTIRLFNSRKNEKDEATGFSRLLVNYLDRLKRV